MSRLCMKEISRALIEMISDESPYASKDMLCGARGAVFREIFIFHYPDFIEKVYMFRKSVCWKMRLEEEKLLGDKLREILEG